MGDLPELAWIKEARSYLGLKEVSGMKHNPKIIAMLEKMGSFSKENKSWWKDDETPWCGLFVGYCLGMVGRFVVPNWFRAKAWADTNYLTKLEKPAYGAIAVYDRTGGGHTGFVVGKDRVDRICILGGNQDNSVSIKSFSKARAVSYWWASAFINGKCEKRFPLDERYKLPKLVGSSLTQSEA